MENVTSDIARKLLTRDLANLAQRVQHGGKLSRSERAMLQSMSAGAGQVPAVGENFAELAKLLGVSRRTLQRWRKRGDAPKSMTNGFHDVALWREFMQRHGLEGEPAGSDDAAALRVRKLLAEAEERELRLAVRKRDHVALEEVRATWKMMVSRAAGLLRNKFEMELPPILSGLDAREIQAECCRAIDDVLTVLHTTDGEAG